MDDDGVLSGCSWEMARIVYDDSEMSEVSTKKASSWKEEERLRLEKELERAEVNGVMVKGASLVGAPDRMNDYDNK